MNKPKTGMRLHKQIALGAKPKEVKTTQGLSSATVPNYKNKKK